MQQFSVAPKLFQYEKKINSGLTEIKRIDFCSIHASQTKPKFTKTETLTSPLQPRHSKYNTLQLSLAPNCAARPPLSIPKARMSTRCKTSGTFVN